MARRHVRGDRFSGRRPRWEGTGECVPERERAVLFPPTPDSKAHVQAQETWLTIADAFPCCQRCRRPVSQSQTSENHHEYWRFIICPSKDRADTQATPSPTPAPTGKPTMTKFSSPTSPWCSYRQAGQPLPGINRDGRRLEFLRHRRTGVPVSISQDHAAHERFRTEWWYYTGQLTSSAGRRFGFQLTPFSAEVFP